MEIQNKSYVLSMYEELRRGLKAYVEGVLTDKLGLAWAASLDDIREESGLPKLDRYKDQTVEWDSQSLLRTITDPSTQGFFEDNFGLAEFGRAADLLRCRSDLADDKPISFDDTYVALHAAQHLLVKANGHEHANSVAGMRDKLLAAYVASAEAAPAKADEPPTAQLQLPVEEASELESIFGLPATPAPEPEEVPDQPVEADKEPVTEPDPPEEPEPEPEPMPVPDLRPASPTETPLSLGGYAKKKRRFGIGLILKLLVLGAIGWAGYTWYSQGLDVLLSRLNDMWSFVMSYVGPLFE